MTQLIVFYGGGSKIVPIFSSTLEFVALLIVSHLSDVSYILNLAIMSNLANVFVVSYLKRETSKSLKMPKKSLINEYSVY